jgi:hypothetical protein
VESPENMAAKKANIEDEFWRVIYLYPIVINSLMVISFILFINQEPIMYCVREGKYE